MRLTRDYPLGRTMNFQCVSWVRLTLSFAVLLGTIVPEARAQAEVVVYHGSLVARQAPDENHRLFRRYLVTRLNDLRYRAIADEQRSATRYWELTPTLYESPSGYFDVTLAHVYVSGFGYQESGVRAFRSEVFSMTQLHNYRDLGEAAKYVAEDFVQVEEWFANLLQNLSDTVPPPRRQ